jgi:23S rRNA pseudouridine955/2504/2580 synthase
MIDILYQSDSLVFIDKPQGVSSQEGESAGKPVLYHFKKQYGYTPLLIHRLDRETSGVMVLAKNHAAASEWAPRMEGGAFSKTYFTFVFNEPPGISGTINEKLVQRGKNIQAITKYDRISSKIIDGMTVSLLRVSIDTGRMHQIRIHFNSRGFPIIADDRHGDFILNRVFSKRFGTKRLMLFSQSISFFESSDGEGKRKRISAPWPERFKIFAEKTSFILPSYEVME